LINQSCYLGAPPGFGGLEGRTQTRERPTFNKRLKKLRNAVTFYESGGWHHWSRWALVLFKR